MSYNTQSYREYELSSRFSLLYCLLCKPFELVGLVKNCSNCMLILGLFYLCVVGSYKIYTESISWQFVQNHHLFDLTLYIDSCFLLTPLPDGVTFLHHDL